MTDAPKTLTEKDPKLRANPHYWLYKITRDVLDNENHPLNKSYNMGHIWNRWSCEGLSDEKAKELGIDLYEYPLLSSADKDKIIDYIHNTEHQTDWDFPNFYKRIFFYQTTWQHPVNFSNFIFRASVNF